MRLFSVCFISIFFICLCQLYQPSICQQTYLDNQQLDCSNEPSITKGYLCYGSGPQTSCQSYAAFRSKPPYDSPTSIAYLLGSDASSIALINNIPPSDKIPSENVVIVPISCSCNGSIYQHIAPYTIKAGDTYFSISNNTYEGLTTCQAISAQNKNVINPDMIQMGSVLTVPVRCACPSSTQIGTGVSSLLTYMVTWGDSFTSIANDFGVDETSILDANMLPQDSIIYPFTPLLIPLKSESCHRNPEKFFCNCRINGSNPNSNLCKSDGKSFPVKLVTILGTSIGLGIVCLCLAGHMLFRFIRNKRRKMLKEKFFKQNGGLLLQQELSSHGTVEKTKIFTAEELQSATDDYNQSRFLGQGGFGTVYKGMLPDGYVVAVKRSKAIDKSQIKQFINEVVILSQINHRNIVKLLGCCLETEVPILVYEFVPNGTLHHHIHDHQQEQESSLSWEHRLRIACEVAGAIAYMHSAASIPIFHRDIKSSNILLDDKYSAKVSDFGTSRSIPNDKTHLTTAVQGTFGYLDPEYFQSSQFTDKSDVYSFGVVLVELLTGRKPISFARGEDQINLVAYFISLAKENKLLQVLDDKVAKEAIKEDIQTIAELAMRCLRLSGKKRPTMKQVALELEGLRRSQNCLEIYQEPDQICREEISFVDTTEETRGQGSKADGMAFSLQMESNSF